MPEGGAHSIGKIPILKLLQGGGKNNKNTKLFKALLHEPFLPFKAPVRILVPSAFYVALQKVQHQATKIPTLSRL